MTQHQPPGAPDGPPTAEMYLPSFFVKQKFAMTTNRYELWAPGPDGQPGHLMALAEQKRLAFRERVTFYADDTRQRPVFSFSARAVIDLASGYDVADEAGRPLGFFKKEFGASLLRTTFSLEGPGYAGTGQERSLGVALLRRFVDVPLLPVHFDFVGAGGRPLMSIERAASLRDRYTVTVQDPALDFRVAGAVAVGLDALLSR